MKDYKKLGHQAPRGYVFNRYFNYVYIKGDLHYCASHDFVYDCVEEERKLYYGKPCYYTDARYLDGRGNFYKDCYLYQSRAKWGAKYTLSLKACMRIVEQCRNIPVGTVVEFNRDWYYTKKNSNRPIPMSYYYKVRKENVFDPKYEINMKGYSRDFQNCTYSQELTEALRENGFIVRVSEGNPDFLMGMIATAQEYTGQERTADKEAGGQIATAYGKGIMLGFSSGDNTYRGYSYGVKSLLFDFFQEFNKWSQCHEIEKGTSPEEVIKLLNEASEEYHERIKNDD